MFSCFSCCMNYRENHGEIELLAARSIHHLAAAKIIAPARRPEFVERRRDLTRRFAEFLRELWRACLRRPICAVVEHRIVQQHRVVMLAVLLLPNIEGRLTPMAAD